MGGVAITSEWSGVDITVVCVVISDARTVVTS